MSLIIAMITVIYVLMNQNNEIMEVRTETHQ